MTTSYSGPAVVVVGDEEFPVDADLRVYQEGGLKTWEGSLRGDASMDLWDAKDPVLRMPDGREGNIIVTSGTMGSGNLGIQGSGPAPF